MLKEIEPEKDFELWDLAKCELVGDYRSFEGIYSCNFFVFVYFCILNRRFALKNEKNYSETMKYWPFQMRITNTNTTGDQNFPVHLMITEKKTRKNI
jgi:hypothetical protein